ncbi:hypothetical protein BT93_J0559 [Corymbia citriodora subsp. variegata]|nr:hypothetical protein BT93_J0559 [Corymbia citriodora subsp. variegata]
MENPATPAAAAPSSSSSSRSLRIVFRTIQSLILLVVLIGAVIAIAWLLLNPRPPAFRLDSLSLSGLPNASDPSSPPSKLHVRIQLNATNPNKKIDVIIEDVNLCLAPVHRKCQLPLSSHNRTSSLEYHISKRGHRVLTFEGKADLRPGGRTRRKRPFPFAVGEDLRKGSVKMKVSVKFMHGYWPSKRASVEVGCEDLSVELSSSTRIWELKDGGKDCSVHFA